jgi:hypothetical protein
MPGPVKLDWIPERVKIESYPVWLFSMGNRSDYLLRMGRDPSKDSKTTFPENGRTEIRAYNPEQFLAKLQPDKKSKITLGRFSDTEIVELSKKYMHTFVTFPLQENRANKKLVQYWIYILENGSSLSLPNMVIYNATKKFAWTRFTQYWGRYMWEYSHVEYPVENMPPRPNVWAEPIKIFDIAPGEEECKIYSKEITLVGRWARWNKSVVAQDAYTQVKNILKEL